MKFYRYEDEPYLEGVHVVERVFKLVKETPCGYWIMRDANFYFTIAKKRWVSKTSRKRFAYPTREEAIESFKARKRRQLVILAAQIRRVEDVLYYADSAFAAILRKEDEE